MLATLVTAALALSSPQTADTKEFMAIFAKRLEDYPTAKADPAIVKCMDLVIEKLRKEVGVSAREEDVQRVIKPYANVIAAKEFTETEYRNLSGAVARGFGRVAVSIQMGGASRMRVFSAASGKEVSVPKTFDWIYQYGSVPHMLAGGVMVVDGMGIQDAGVRYGYRAWCLRPVNGKYELTKTLPGLWTLSDGDNYHLGLNGSTLGLRWIEEPKSFFTDNTTRVHSVYAEYDLQSGTPVRKRLVYKEPAVLAADRWMAKAMAAPVSEVEKQFAKAYGKERQMLEEWSESLLLSRPAKVEFAFDGKRYAFTLKESAGTYQVAQLSIK